MNNKSIRDQLKWISKKKAALFKKRIDDLVCIHGSVRAVGKALDIDHAYLHRLRNGQKVNPSDEILRKLDID